MDMYDHQADGALADAGNDGQTNLSVGQIVFIDGAVPDAQVLAAGVKSGVRAVILDPARDGVQQIAAYLSAFGPRKLSSIAIVSHGASGVLQLGSAMLDVATLARYATELALIGESIDIGGDLLLYGCDVAQDDAGIAFVHQLSDATGGVDIAAAAHLVGAADQGGSFVLDVNVGAIEATTPFTAETQAAFPALLPTAVNQLYFTTRNAPSPFSANRIEQIGVSGTTQVGAPIDLRDGSQQTFAVLQGVAVDPSLGRYFVVNSNANTANQILQGDVINGGSLSTFLSAPTPLNQFQILGIEIDQPNHDLYYSLASTNSGSIGIWKVNEFSGAPTQVIGGFSTTNVPQKLALDLADNLIFFVDARGINQASTLWVGNVLSHTATALTTKAAGTLLSGIAINNGTIYFSVINGGTAAAASNGIFSAPYTVTGSGSSTTASLGPVSTLYAGANAKVPVDITIDPTTGLLYTVGSDTPTPGVNFTTAFVNVGTITGGGSLQSVFTLNNGTNGVTGSSLFLETTPTITATGTVAFNQTGAAIKLAPGAQVTNPSGFTLASATVAITGGTFANDGDTLTATTSGTGISAIFSGNTLTLTGDDTAVHYQQVLDTVTYNNTSNNPTNGGAAATRTFTWTVNDGIIASASPTTTLTINALPTITPAATATFTGGGSAVTLSPALTVVDPSGPALTSAKVTISGFVAGDVLNFVNQGGITGSFNSGTGTLSLSGAGSASTYQAALRSITYGFNPANGDPTAGGGKTSRTIGWSVTDGILVNNAASTTLNVIHAAPTITVAGNVSFAAGGGAVALDPAASVFAPDSLDLLSKATITIDAGLFPGDGDVLSATVTGTAITASYNSATEVLILSGSDSTAHWQQVLRTVSIATTSGDPTGGGAHTSRTITWMVNDGVADSAPDSTTATALCFLAGTRIMTPSGERPVEDLRPGDPVTTAAGVVRPLTWVGHGRVLATRGRRGAATPVIVRRGALADGVPSRDLFVTKGHALFLDDVLIPVECLVNHRSIEWDDHAQEVALYHLELDSHDVLLANGAPAESYRDDGNRWLFHNGDDTRHLTPQPPCAPLLMGGPVVDALWRRLWDRAPTRALPPLTDDPDLHLLADGRRIDPQPLSGGRVIFRLPTATADLRLVSRDAIPAELGLARDFRALGVAVRRIVAQSGRTVRVIEADAPQLACGFHPFEPEDGIRWTNGDAALPPDLLAGLHGCIELLVALGPTTRYPAGLSVRRAA